MLCLSVMLTFSPILVEELHVDLSQFIITDGKCPLRVKVLLQSMH